jgi:hypothetical protein
MLKGLYQTDDWLILWGFTNHLASESTNAPRRCNGGDGASLVSYYPRSDERATMQFGWTLSSWQTEKDQSF